MEILWQDVRYAVRTLLKSPAFTAAAVLSLALGIGANTTIFTLVNTLFLNPLAVEKPAELVALYTLDTKNTTQFGNLLPLSYPNLSDFREKNAALTDLAGYSFPLPLSLTGSWRGASSPSSDGAPPPSRLSSGLPPRLMGSGLSGDAPERVFAQLVTGNYFEVLGLRPAAGRFFATEEDRGPGTHAVAVIGHAFWLRRFGGDPGIVGRTIGLNTVAFTVVGIAPEGFRGVTSIFGPDMWLPSMMAAQVLPASAGDWLNDRGALALTGAGRLKPGVTIAQAEANLKTLAQTLEQAYPKPNTGRSVSLEPLTEATLFPGMRGPLLFGGAILMTIVGLVLLIACSNVANLLLARAMARRREIAVRLAVGASRTRLIRQLLSESLVLSLVGGALGLILGIWGRDLLWSARPAVVAQNFVELNLDARVLAFTFIVSLATGVVFGLAPALQASRSDVVGALKQETPAVGRGRRLALRNTLVVGQVAFSLFSLIVAGLFLRSIAHAHAISLGYETKSLAVLSINPGQGGYDRPRGEQFYREVGDRVSTLAGVTSVSWASNQPLWASVYRSVFIEGRQQQDESEAILTLVNTVDLDYFRTIGIGVTRGRDFTDADREAALPVAIINETMAGKYWLDQDPVGKRFRLGTDGPAREVVGVVKTVRYQRLGEAPQPCVYLPLRQNYSDAMVLYVRTEGDPARVLPTIEREVRSLDRQVPVENVATVEQAMEQSLWMVKLGAGLLGVFGSLALVLASLGLYGTMAYSVGQQRREIGLRMALGADRSGVLRLVLRQGMILVAVGVVFGLGASWLAGRVVSTFFFGMSATDPLTFLSASLGLLLVALAAIYFPARRASRLDPLVALRQV